jgi:hypothetical protein
MTRKPKPKPTRPEPSPRMLARIAEAKRRNAERLQRPSVEYKLKPSPNGGGAVGEIMGSRGVGETLLDVFGTTSMDFVEKELERLSNYQRTEEWSDPKQQRDLNAAIAAIDGMRPENEMAAMLTGQMVATHALAMDMLGRAKRAEFTEQLHASGSLATKLLRTYTMQIEALAKLKRGGEQIVRVEHVHVYSGGQAIVGTVTNHRGEGGVADGKWTQSDGASNARALAFAPSAAMFGPDASGNALPEGGSDRQKTLPDARRSPRQRSTER